MDGECITLSPTPSELSRGASLSVVEESPLPNAELAFPVGEGGPLAVDEVVLGIQNEELRIPNEELSTPHPSASPPPSPQIKGEGNVQNAKTDEAQAQPTDTKAHLTSSVPRSARAPIGVLTKSEIGELRNIFANLSDTEIQRLYKRVTKQN